MFEDKIKDEIQSSVSICFGEHIKTADIIIEKPSDKKFGDFSSNISFQLAGKLKKSPNDIAEKLVIDLIKTNNFEKVEAVSGFINFKLKKEKYFKVLEDILKNKESFAKNNVLKNKKIQVEFISANPTGPLTLANGRGGYSGDTLSNVLAFCGANVEREYYVNDGGNQVKILGESVLVSAGLLKKEDDIYRGEYIDKWVKDNKKEIEKLKEKPFEIGYLCAKYVMENYIKAEVKSMKIGFDNWYSEKSLYDRGLVEKALSFLDNKKLTYEKDDAKWLKTSEFGDDKDRVIVKTNGEYTYVMPDIAYHWEKFTDRKYNQVIDILGADHHGYTERMLAGVATLGYRDNLTYILTQMVRLVKNGKEFRMSKRKGVVVTIEDLFELIGGETSEASDVARFFFLSRSFNTHMDFDLDLAKERSEKNPVFYVKYAYARTYGILSKSNKNNSKPNLKLLTEDAEIELIDKLSELPALVQMIATTGDYPVHLLTSYAIEVAKKFHHFYDKCRVIDEENPELTNARLSLVSGTKIILGIVGKDLIGIDMPDKM